MKERPIIFTADSIRGILSGRKTQTRRVMKQQPYTLRAEGFGYPTKAGGFVSIKSPHCLAECPYGVPGDRLWVRETFFTWRCKLYSSSGVTEGPNECVYRADGGTLLNGAKWKSSMFMPRWASRIMLEITDMRVERVQDISDEDCRAEGCKASGFLPKNCRDVMCPIHHAEKAEFQKLWDSINGKDHPWGNNDWVWAISFKRVEQNA